MFVAEFRYACFTHAYIFYLSRQYSVQLKNLKGDVDNNKLKLDKWRKGFDHTNTGCYKSNLVYLINKFYS